MTLYRKTEFCWDGTEAIFGRVLSYADSKDLLPDKARVLVALSGGPDSTFLLNFLVWCAEFRDLEIGVAHFNHRWRESASTDARFCEEISLKLGVPFFYGEAAPQMDSEGGVTKSEEVARELRLRYLEETRERHNYDVIAIGHTADDQIETVLIRFIRGATLAGLAGMMAVRGKFIRPLLQTRKSEILEFLANNRIEYITDPTNLSRRYLRNRIRHDVIPALIAADARFEPNFLRAVDNLQQANDFIERLARRELEAISVLKLFDNSFERHVSLKKLLALDDYFRRRLISSWLIDAGVRFVPTESFFNEILKFLKTPGGGVHSLGLDWGIKKRRSFAWIVS